MPDGLTQCPRCGMWTRALFDGVCTTCEGNMSGVCIICHEYANRRHDGVCPACERHFDTDASAPIWKG